MNQNTTPVDKQWAATAEIDLRQYWQVISRAKGKILLFALASSLLATLWVFSVDPVYQASATLLVESGSAKVISIEEVYDPDSGGKEYYQTQFELLNSPTIAQKVTDELQLLQHPEYESLASGASKLNWRNWLPGKADQAGPGAQATLRQRMVATYLDHLDISPVDNTQLVKVKFEAHDAALAADIANAHARSYISDMLETKLGFSQSAASWMAERLQVVKSDLRESERALQEFREREQVFDAEGLQSLPTKELNELTSRLVEARRALALARSSARQVERLQESNPDELDSIPAVLQNDLVQLFKEQKADSRRNMAELRKTYGPQHPKMIAAISESKNINLSLRRQINSVVKGIKKNYEMAKAEEQALRESIEQAKQEYHVTGRKESDLLNLQREVQTNRQLYDIFYNRMKETAEAGGLQAANARVVSPAVVPLDPIKPNKALTISMTFVGSLLLGVLLAFLAESLDNTIKSPVDVETKLQVPFLGAIPLIKTKHSQPLALGRTFLGTGEPDFKEAIRTIRTGITLSALHNPHKVLMVTSAAGGEGKSIAALNLAYASGQLEQVLLIECDLRRPSIAVQLKLPADMPGLSQLLANEASLDECIVYPDSDKIQFITAGAVPSNPLELLAAPAFTKLILQLRHDYDLVIADCPPILPVSDATMIATQMDAAIYVARAGSTPLNQVKAGLEKLRQTDVPVIGVIVNALDARAVEYYGSGYANQGPVQA